MEAPTSPPPAKITLLDKELRLVIYIQKKLSPWFDYPAITLHYIIKDEILLLITPISIFLCNYYAGSVLTISCLIVEIYAGILKWAFRLPRPLWHDTHGELINRKGEWEGDYGFPSSHSMLITSIATIILLIYIDIKYDAPFMKNHDINEDRNVYLIFFCVALVLSVVTGLSRTYFAVHYPRDVIVGYMLGVLLGLAVYYLFKVTRDINEWASIGIGIALIGVTLSLMILIRPLFPQDKVQLPVWEANALRAWNARKEQSVAKHPVGIHPRSIGRYLCMYGILFGVWISDPIFRLSHNGNAYHECQEWKKTKFIRFGIGCPVMLFFLAIIFLVLPKTMKRKTFSYPAKVIFGFLVGVWMALVAQIIFDSTGYNKC